MTLVDIIEKVSEPPRPLGQGGSQINLQNINIQKVHWILK